MANNCYFEIKIAGEKQNVEEFIQMLQWKGPFETCGAGRVYSFDVNDFEIETSDKNNLFAVTGAGDCAWSVLTAMCAESRGGFPSLESETRRLNLVVEIYSSEPGVGFQEHYLFDHGNVIEDECIDFEETWTLEMTEEEIKEFCEENEITREQFDNGINENGDYITGGYGDRFGEFEDLFTYFDKEQDKDIPYYFVDDFSDAYPVKPYLDVYTSNKNLFIGLLYEDPSTKTWQPYSDVTVNITSLPYLYGAVDLTLNKEGTLRFLREYSLGEDTGKTLCSGFNQYPVFHFNEEKIREIDPEVFECYAKAKGHTIKDKPSLESMIVKASHSSSTQVQPEQTKDVHDLSNSKLTESSDNMIRYAEIPEIRKGVAFSDPGYDASVWCQYRAQMSAFNWLLQQKSKCSADGYHDFEIKIGRPTVMGQVKFEDKNNGLLIQFPTHYEIEHYELGMDTACIFCGTLENFELFGEEAAIRTGSDGYFADLFEFKVRGEDKPIGFVLHGSVDHDLVDEVSLFQSISAGFDGKEISLPDFEKRISEKNIDYMNLRHHELVSAKLHEVAQKKKSDIEPER